MVRLGEKVLKVRSKNAGPFWVTIDVFCGDAATYADVVRRLSTEQVARLFGVPPERLKRFDIADLHVVKFSLPRPVVQGSRYDRDMHGAQWAALLSEAELGD
jgi:hypothetical protein